MKNLLVRIPETLHRRMRAKAATTGTTVKAFVTEAIETAVEKGGKK